MTTIFLLRHGEIPSFSPRRFIGRQDVPLTSNGRKQMQHMASFLAAHTIDRLVCSPLTRCRQSGNILTATIKRRPEILPELTELNLGSWEGLTVAEVEACFPGQYEARGEDIARFRPDQGESFADLLDRVWPVFSSITSTNEQHIAVVAHAGVNRVLLCRILGMPLANLFRLNQSYGCLNILTRNTRGFQVECLNYLPDAAR